MSDVFRDAVRDNARAVLRLDKPDLRAIVGVLQDVRDHASDQLSRLVAASQGKTYTAVRHAQAIRSARSAQTVLERRLREATGSSLVKQGRAAADDGLAHAKAMAEAGARRFRGISASLRLPEVAILSSHDRSVAARYPHSAARYAGEVGRQIRRDMAVGVARGESLRDTARRMMSAAERERARLRDQPTPEQLGEAMGHKTFFRGRWDAERLLRTETCSARAATQIETLREADRDDHGYMKRWDAIHDGRLCRRCRVVDGEVRPLDALFSCGVYHPPLHPCDRCTIVPHHLGWGVVTPMEELR